MRGDFVKNLSEMVPNDYRFDMNEDYDKSTYLTKVRRIQGREFDSYSKRRSDVTLKQAGDITKTDILRKGARSEEFYKAEQKE